MSVVSCREQSPSSDCGSRRGQCKWGRCHHCGGLFLLALAEALWLGFGIGTAGTRMSTHHLWGTSAVHKDWDPHLSTRVQHTGLRYARHSEGHGPSPPSGGSPWPGGMCMYLERCVCRNLLVPAKGSGPVGCRGIIMINRRRGHWGCRGGIWEDVSSIDPMSASWSPSASWGAGSPLEVGSVPPPGSALRGTWA